MTEIKESVLNMLKFEHLGKNIRVTTNHREFRGVLIKIDYFGRMVVKMPNDFVLVFPRWVESIEVFE